MSPAIDNTTATPTKINAIIRVFPSLTDAAFLLPVVFVLLMFSSASDMLEGDTGWHIRTGEWIIQNGRVPDTDMFSFTKAGEPWFAWEWLWDVVFAWLHATGGMAAVVFASLAVLCFTSALLFRLVRRACSNPLIAFGVTCLAIAMSSMHWLARPHIFTMLFVVIFLHILERARDGSYGLLWLLAPLTVVWVNLHAGFVIGLILIGTYCVGELASGLMNPVLSSRSAAFHRGRIYAIALASCLAVTILNPYTYKLHLHVSRYLLEPTLYNFANEWQPTAVRGLLGLYLEPFILLAVTAAVWQFVNRRYTYSLLLVAFLHSAFVAVRNVPIFAFVAAPAVAAVLKHAFERARNASHPAWLRKVAASFDAAATDFDAVDRIPRIHVVGAASLLLLALGFFSVNPPEKLRAEYKPDRYPVAAIDSLGGFISPTVFTDDEWGDYIIYRLYPRNRVYMDGRFDMYGGEFTEAYLKIVRGSYDWESRLRNSGIEQILLPVAHPLASTLKESSRWQVMYDDGVAILFRWRRNSVPSTTVVPADTGNQQNPASSPPRLAHLSDQKGGSVND